MRRIKCPVCEGGLRRDRVEYSYHDVSFGTFEADVCEDCGEVFFTEEASQEIEMRAREQGLWGLEARSRVSYSGNSLMVRIPKEIAQFLDLERGDEIRLHPEGKRRLVVELVD